MPQKGLSGSTLKLIAIITMLIDHIGAAVIARLLIAGQGSEMLYKIYYAMRAVGRVAFPIFCFLLVEGFFTRVAGKICTSAVWICPAVGDTVRSGIFRENTGIRLSECIFHAADRASYDHAV